jgi:imidazoleglycerol phosphate dehydratase HisB
MNILFITDSSLLYFDRDATVDQKNSLPFTLQEEVIVSLYELQNKLSFSLFTKHEALHPAMMELFTSQGCLIHDIKSFSLEALRDLNTFTVVFSGEKELDKSSLNAYTNVFKSIKESINKRKLCGVVLINKTDFSNEIQRHIPLPLQELFDEWIIVPSWNALKETLKYPPRKAAVSRKTLETQIEISLNLDGSGRTNISTGLGFFDHMLTLFGKHSECDLEVFVKGDLEVDEHHTIEDTALALGQAFNDALKDKNDVQRYAFLLPMDESLAQVAIDFSGRPWLVWDAEFKREKIGEMPTEMFYHFFKSFTDTAKCTLNIKVTGDNEHHKIEAIFKAVGKVIKNAVKRESGKGIPSTKGVL